MVDPPPGNYSGQAGNSTEEAVDRIRLQVMNYMYLHAGIAALLLLLVLLYFPARPASLPSVSAGEQRENFTAGIKAADLCIAGGDRNTWALLLCWINGRNLLTLPPRLPKTEGCKALRSVPQSILSNRSALMVVAAFTLSQGVQEAYYPVMDLNLAPIGVSEARTVIFWPR